MAHGFKYIPKDRQHIERIPEPLARRFYLPSGMVMSVPVEPPLFQSMPLLPAFIPFEVSGKADEHG